MSGRLPLKKKRISLEEFCKLIQECEWYDMSSGENMSPRFSKKFFIRKKKEFSVHRKEKQPYVTIFALGGIIIVGLRNKSEANAVYDLVIKDLKKCGVGLNEQ